MSRASAAGAGSGGRSSAAAASGSRALGGGSTPRVAVVILLFIFLGASRPAAGQICRPLTDPTCSQFFPVGTDIFVPSWATIEQLQILANRETGVLNFSPVWEPCHSTAIQMTCYTYLRPCQKINNVSVPIPQQPCLHICDHGLWHHCKVVDDYFGLPFGAGLFFPPGTAPPLNCSSPPLDVDVDNTPFWAANMSTYTYEGQNYTLPCSTPELISPVITYCTDPLVPHYRADLAHEACSFTCPLPSLSDSQYDSVKVMQGIVGWMSWVGTAFLIFSMALDPAARDFPRNLITMTACAANVAAGAIILPTMVGYQNIWCGGDPQYVTPKLEIISIDPDTGFVDIRFLLEEEVLSFSSGPCTFQGAILQFGFLSAAFWWVITAFNMCLELYLGKTLSLENHWWKWGRFIVYNIIAWGLAFLLTIVPAAAGEIKFASGATYCFVSTLDNDAWILTFWFVPVGIALLMGVTLFIFALIRVTILLVTIKKMKELLLLHVRLFVFIFLYLFLFLLIFSYNIQIEADKGNIISGYEDYYQCLIYAEPDCHLSDSVSNYDLVMLKGWAISSLGILLFLTFIFGPIMTFYYRLFKGLVLAIYFRRSSYLTNVARMIVATKTSTLSMSMDSHSLSMAEGGGQEDDFESGPDGKTDEEDPTTNTTSTSD